jgi:hypothetical protein
LGQGEKMPETWVHGNAFDRASGVGAQREGHMVRFYMDADSTRFYHASIPVMGQQTLQEVRVEFSTSPTRHTGGGGVFPGGPRLIEAWVHQGGTYVTQTGSPTTTTTGGTSTFSLGGINTIGNRGICISLAFTVAGPQSTSGYVNFFGAGAIFA